MKTSLANQSKQTKTKLQTLAILLCPLVLNACASDQRYTTAPIENRSISNNSSTAPKSVEHSRDQATPLNEREVLIEQAEYYERLASDDGNAVDDSESRRVDATLSSAEYYIQANDFRQAKVKLDELDGLSLNSEQNNRARVIDAYVAYSNGDFNTALATLSPLTQDLLNDSIYTKSNADDELTRVVQYASREQADALLLSAFCFQQLDKHEAAITALVAREASLVGAARAETTRYTWHVIDSLSAEQKQSIIENTRNPRVRNRLEQSLGGQIEILEDEPAKFTQWRESTPDLESYTPEQTVESAWGPNSPRNIAILLPLSSKFDKASQALLDGFKFQNEQNLASYQPLINVYDVGDNPYQIEQYYTAAIRAGADVVIGPLGTDFANQLSQRRLSSGAVNPNDGRAAAYGSDPNSSDPNSSDSYKNTGNNYSDLDSLNNVPTILLGGDMRLANGTIRLSLSPENEGRQIANKAFSDGHSNAVVLAPESSTAKRMVAAFTARWLQLGGKVNDVVSYSPAQFDHRVELKQMFKVNQSEYRYTKLSNTLGLKPEFSAYRRADIDFILLVANNASGRIVRPQINFFGGSSLPVYASSSIYNGISKPSENMDLERTRFPVMPWVIRSENVAHYAGTLNELFALGSDAYTVAGNLTKLRNNPQLAIRGNTGRLSITAEGEVINEPVWAQFIQGEATPIGARGKNLDPLKNIDQDDLEPSIQQGVYNDSNWDSRNSRRKTGS